MQLNCPTTKITERRQNFKYAGVVALLDKVRSQFSIEVK